MSGLMFSMRVICTGCGYRQDFKRTAVDFEPALATGNWPEGIKPSCEDCGPLTFDPKRLRMPYHRSRRTMYRSDRQGQPEVRLTIRGIPTRVH